MPQPTQSQVHVDTLLTDLLIGFRNQNYIADEAAPIKIVSKQSNLIAKVNQSAFFRDDSKIRGAGSKSFRSGWTVDNTASYYCPSYALGHEIPDEVRDNADAPYDMDREAAYFVANSLQLARERAFANSIFTSSAWGTTKTAGVDFTQWSNYAGSFPLDDISQWKDQIEGSIGVEGNTMIIGKQVWVGSGGLSNGGGLKWHPTVLDTIKYTQRGLVSTELVASLAELDKILIGRAIFTSTVEGTAESSVVYSRVYGKNALVYYNAPASIWSAPALTTFVWGRVANAIQYIKRFRDEERELEVIEGRSYFTHKVLVSNAGVFASGVVN